MTAYLADSHVLLWLWRSPEQLTKAQEDALASTAQVYISIAAIWELSIKASLGKLIVPPDLADEALRLGFDFLPVEPRHTNAVRMLPHHHGDPFDRMMIAQAMVEDLTMITSDRKIANYDVSII